ncbi:MAG: type II toxin-antitoxin system VapC family toxin [Fibrobacterota bacterium]
MSRIILDTNAVSSFFSGNREVLASFEEAGTIFMSVVVMGELYAGFHGGSLFKRNKDFLHAFLKKPTVKVLAVSDETAEIFGAIKHQLRQAGTPLPVNDIWLAAQTMETGAKLVTYDRHFLLVPGLRLWSEMEFGR